MPHVYSIWKILKNPIVRRPIVAGYKWPWILTKASIFVGHYLKEFYSKFKNMLTDSLKDCFYFHNVLQELVYQHFSSRRNKSHENIVF